MFTKNGHDIVKLSIEFSNWVCDISKACITKKIYTKIFYFIDPMYWFTIDMYSTGRRIRTTKSDQLAFSRIKLYAPLSALFTSTVFCHCLIRSYNSGAGAVVCEPVTDSEPDDNNDNAV